VRRSSEGDRALVLRVSSYGEADAIVSLLTQRNGVVSAIAKRARAGGRRRVVLEPFHTLAVELAAGNGELWSLRSSTIERARIALLDDGARLEVAGEAMRWIRVLSPARTPEPEVFAAAIVLLDRLAELGSNGGSPEGSLAAFGLELLDALGYALELSACARCARPRPTGRAAYLLGRAGGVLCETCRRGVTGSAPLLDGVLLDRLAADPQLEEAALLPVVREAIEARAQAVGRGLGR
jgi:DNA repair protein RecO (recombination protein O)